MIELEKNTYIKIGEFANLCRVNRWGNEDEWFYVLAVNSIPKYLENSREIYGFGKTAEEALLSGIDGILKSALKGTPLKYLAKLHVEDVLELINSNQGSLSTSDTNIEIYDPQNEHIKGQEMSVLIEKDKCYAFLM